MLSLFNTIGLFLTVNILRPLIAIPFHPENFVKNLKYMGTGMLCIIIVMAVIIGVVMLLNKASAAAAARKAAKEDSDNEQ